MPLDDHSATALSEAAFALARGEALRALSQIGRAEGALGALLRGIAYAQLGDLELARETLESVRAKSREPLLVARASAALAEVEIASGDASGARRSATRAAAALEQLGDARNAAMQRLVVARAEVLLGRPTAARDTVSAVIATSPPDDVRAVAQLALAEIAVRELAASRAQRAIADARAVLDGFPNDLLARAVTALEAELSRPIARVMEAGEVRAVDAFGIEAASQRAVVVDACRRLVASGRATIPLASRPILFALLLPLARAFPGDVPRDELAKEAFEAKRLNESHRSRLRVEVGRLRKELEGLVALTATPRGYALVSARPIVVLLPPSDDHDAKVALLLADGAAWTAQAVAEHAGISKRTAQRALSALVEEGRAIKLGSGRAVRYASASAPIASRLLLLGLVPTT
ncbi:MAG TPA: helix-turn-helix domain-containing protein [Polyangiaceae bacterium]